MVILLFVPVALVVMFAFPGIVKKIDHTNREIVAGRPKCPQSPLLVLDIDPAPNCPLPRLDYAAPGVRPGDTPAAICLLLVIVGEIQILEEKYKCNYLFSDGLLLPPI